MHSTRVGVDLAKDVIQVCVFKRNKVQSNIEMTPDEFHESPGSSARNAATSS